MLIINVVIYDKDSRGKWFIGLLGICLFGRDIPDSRSPIPNAQ